MVHKHIMRFIYRHYLINLSSWQVVLFFHSERLSLKWHDTIHNLWFFVSGRDSLSIARDETDTEPTELIADQVAHNDHTHVCNCIV